MLIAPQVNQIDEKKESSRNYAHISNRNRAKRARGVTFSF